MRLAAGCGISPGEVWALTPWEVMRAARHARETRQREALSLAWHCAAFSGAAQAGKLKDLGEYLKPERLRVAD